MSDDDTNNYDHPVVDNKFLNCTQWCVLLFPLQLGVINVRNPNFRRKTVFGDQL